MAKLFNNTNDIILHNPAPFNEKISKDDKSWILIPAIAYKVLIPEAKERKLNLFQETILKLFKSGNKNINFLEDNLLLDRKLIEYIINEFHVSGYIDDNNLVTQKGTNVLADEDEDYKNIVGYIFYDVVSNKFWDAFVPDEDYKILENDGFGQEFRRFKYGDLGKPIKGKAVVVKEETEAEIREIDSLEIHEVCIKHKIRLSNMTKSNYNMKNYTFPKRIEKIKYLDEATPIYLATYMYYPKDLTKQSKWQVCHPFYGGTSNNLRLELDKLKETPQNENLKKCIDDLVFTSLNVTADERKNLRNEDDKRFYEALEKRLSKNIENYSSLTSILLEMNRNFEKIEKMKVNRGKRYDEIQEKLGENVVLAQESLEVALKILAGQYEGYYNDKLLSNNIYENSKKLGLLAKRCGFKEQFPDIFQKFFKLKKGNIKYALENAEMKALVALNLLISDGVNEHSFFNLAKQVPEAIDFLSDLLIRRNENNHNYSIEDNERDIKVIYLKVLYIISLLFEDLTFRYDGKISFYTFEECEEKEIQHIDMKVRMQADHEVESDIGKVIRDYPDIKKLLMNGKIRLIKRKGMCIVDFCKVFESLLNVIADRMLDKKAKDRVPFKPQESVAYIEKNIKKLGFNFNSAELPDSFKRVPTNKIKNGFESFEMGTLGSKTYTTLYSAIENDSELIEKIGYESPELINIIARIADIRHHHGSSIEFSDEFIEIYTEIAKAVKVILKNLSNKKLH